MPTASKKTKAISLPYKDSFTTVRFSVQQNAALNPALQALLLPFT